MADSVRIQPAWPAIKELTKREQRFGLLHVTEFLDNALPTTWQIYVRPRWLDAHIDMVLIHESNGFVLISVYEGGSTSGATPALYNPLCDSQPSLSKLQKTCTRLLKQSACTIYNLLKSNPKAAHLFRFGLYVYGAKGPAAREQYPLSNKRQFVIGDDDLVQAQVANMLPNGKKTGRLMQSAWAHELAACLQVDNHHVAAAHVQANSSASKKLARVDVQPVPQPNVQTGWHRDHTVSSLQNLQRVDKGKQSSITQRSQLIQQFCTQQQIEHVVHFTRLANLASILGKGLLSRATLEMLPVEQRPLFNDQVRADQQKDTVSLSISFPNYRMFYAFHNTQSSQWVVLQLDKAVLWQLDCAFCVHNAASNAIRKIPLSERRNVSMLERMFGDLPDKPRTELHIPKWFPTDPQAEILVLDSVASSYIQTVNFFHEAALREWCKTQSTQYRQSFVVNPEFFDGRCDSRHWKSDPMNEIIYNQAEVSTIPF